MSDTDTTIPPALSAEEWAEVYQMSTIPLFNYLSASEHASLTRRQRHAAAALLLHQQSFGFTREDVARIREAAQTMQWSAIWMGEDDKSPAAMLRALAERIAALLPPKKP